MILQLIILCVTCIVEICIVAYMLTRSEWAFWECMRLIDGGISPMNLPDQRALVCGHGFWRWDIDYFIRRSVR